MSLWNTAVGSVAAAIQMPPEPSPAGRQGPQAQPGRHSPGQLESSAPSHSSKTWLTMPSPHTGGGSVVEEVVVVEVVLVVDVVVLVVVDVARQTPLPGSQVAPGPQASVPMQAPSLH
jgi:hypothetical protein